MAKKTYEYREVLQKEAARKAKAADTRRARKRAEREAWWTATPAQGNYVELKAHVATREGDIPRLEKVSVTGRVLPDKRQADRRWSSLSVSLSLRGDADREAIARQLTALASLILTSEEPWRTAAGAPLPHPMRIEGLPIQLVPTPFRSTTPERPSPTVGPQPTPIAHPFQDLLSLRARLQRWLSAHRRDDSPLATLSVEPLAEVLLMRVCGDDIALVSERDPWRWDHTPEELQAANAALAGELETLSALVLDLSSRLGAAAAIAVLLAVFVEGRSV